MSNRILSLLLVIATLFSFQVFVSAEDVNHNTRVSASDLFTEKESAYAAAAAASAANMEAEYVFPTPVSETEFSRIMNIFYNDYPELFHLKSSYSYATSTDPSTGETVVVKVIFKYAMSPEEYDAGKTVMENWAAEVIAMGDESFGEEQWALFFHDYLASRYGYDYSLERNTAHALVVDGIGVCRAYHLAYVYLLRAVGIECSLAVSSEMVHVWTMVKIGGNWHHVDSLWDDGMDGAWGRATHNYFLLCDHVISDEEGKHYGWIAKYTATCHSHTRDDLDYSDTAFVFGKGKWYYLHDGILSYTTDIHTPGTDIIDLNLKWHVWGDSNAAYKGTFSGIIYYNGDIIFNGEKNLYVYDVQTKALRVLWENPATEGYIYGFKKIGDEIHLDITTKPSSEGTDVVVKPFIVDTGVTGDISGDGKRNLKDAADLMKYSAGWSVGICKSAADLTGDGKLNLADVSKLMKILAGWDIK